MVVQAFVGTCGDLAAEPNIRMIAHFDHEEVCRVPIF
jgi:hypothetical protein